MKFLQQRNYKYISALSIVFGGMLMASIAVASNGYGGGPHGGGHHGDDGYHEKHQKEPRFVDRGDSLRARATVRNLNRKRNVRVELEAEAEVEIECVHKGAHHKRYIREINIEVDGSEFYSRHKVHDGRLDVRVETDEIDEYFLDDYYGHACKKNYNAYVREVAFSSAKLEVRQGHREVVTWLCSFDRDTNNGPVPRSNVDCVTLY